MRATLIHLRTRNLYKTYSEAMQFEDFKDRFNYLKIGGRVGEETFGYCRYLNQILYRSPEWKRFRREIVIRDAGCDLAYKDLPIYSNIFVHHINPISLKDIEERNFEIFNPENVICCSFETHNAIHYADESLLPRLEPAERKPNDHCPWRN